MKNLMKIGLVLVAFFMCLSVNAQDKQISFGVKAGLNLSSFGGDKEYKDMDSKLGFNAGLTLDYNIMGDLYLLSGLELTTKGAKESYKDEYEDYTVTINPMYLQIPIHVGYKFELSEGMKFVVNAGPYFAYGLGGKIKTKEDGITGSIDIFKDQDIDGFNIKGMKRFDLGIGVGLGLEFGALKFGLGYDLGLLNPTPSYSDYEDYEESNEKFTLNNLYLTVGFKF